MSWRFRKSISILPGIKINLNGKSASISVGKKGMHTTLNTKGRITNSFGIPGTGLSYRTSHKVNLNNHSNGTTTYSKDKVERTTTGFLNKHESIKLEKTIRDLYGQNIGKLDWLSVLKNPLTDDSTDDFKEIKTLSYKILSGDIESYSKALNLFHPFSDVLSLGCRIKFKAIDSDTVSFHFFINSKEILSRLSGVNTRERNIILQDLITGITLSIARDAFYLLPVKTIYVDAEDQGIDILSVYFDIDTFSGLDLDTVNAPDAMLLFRHEMKWSETCGFTPIVFLDEHLMC